MKLVVAIVRSERLGSVLEELFKAEVQGVSISRIQGHGPAMTMSFKLADPSAVPELAPGQRIEFRFTTEGGGTVTAIEPAE